MVQAGLESCVELIAMACVEHCGISCSNRSGYGIRAAGTGDNQVLVVWRDENTRVVEMKIGMQCRNAVNHSYPRLHALICRQSIVLVKAKTQVGCKVPELDEILREHGELFDIGIALEVINFPAAGEVDAEQAGQKGFVRSQAGSGALRRRG